MTGDELIERIAEAIRATWTDEDEYGDMTDAARAAIRVVLTAVADDLNEHVRAIARDTTTTDAEASYWFGRRDGLVLACNHLRSLLPKETSDD